MDQLLVEALAGRSEPEGPPDLWLLADLLEEKMSGKQAAGSGQDLSARDRFLVDVTAEALGQWRDETVEPSAVTDVADPVVRRIKAVLLWAKEGLQFVWGTVQPLPLAPAAAVRSSANRLERAYCVFDAPLPEGAMRIEFERLPSDGLDVQISAVRPSSAAGWRATLVRRGKLVESAPFDAGQVRFSGLSPDAYKVELSTAGKVLAEIDLSLLRD